MAGAVAEAGACVTADTMNHFKLGQMLDVPPDILLMAHIVGALWGAIVSCISYRLVISRSGAVLPVNRSSAYGTTHVPMVMPLARIWLMTAELALGQGMPEKAKRFSVCTGVVFICVAVVKGLGQKSKSPWVKAVMMFPSGTSFAMGM
jgi:uncharacterized oligopeptide transporter (OPT) family protein